RYADHPSVCSWSGVHQPEDFAQRARDFDWTTLDAVYFRTDRIAIPALAWFRERGIRIPDDLEVISFDNFPFSQHTMPSLSSWDLGMVRLAHRANEHLIRWMKDDLEPPSWEQIQPQFMARSSHRGSV
ncbi:MAG: LacI family DNA-binding transcriptional regulator, partial [Spirochaetales bacterium]|nr:LacI family DNA-binding transcriptional regulator [Spirochaetales bacterium]